MKRVHKIQLSTERIQRLRIPRDAQMLCITDYEGFPNISYITEDGVITEDMTILCVRYGELLLDSTESRDFIGQYMAHGEMLFYFRNRISDSAINS